MDCTTVDFWDTATLLIHDGELEDVRDLLEELEVGFVERDGAPTSEDEGTSWDLVIATPKRILDFEIPESFPPPVRIAVLADGARTLRNILKRETIEFLVRRPVHPEALRLLILHALYRGPEKREAARVTIGAPIRFRIGWRWRRAILVDLSPRGCRLLSSDRMRRGERMELNLPSELAGPKALTLTGRVMWCRTAVPGRSRRNAIAVDFEGLSREAVKRLQAMVERHASGPAALPSSIMERYAIDDAEAPPSPVATCSNDAKSQKPPSDDSEADATPDEGSETKREARGVRGERRHYARRVIALGDEIARVLIGRDLSLGGMRVDPHPGLSLGDTLQIAVYARTGEQPVVVSAEISRDDGDKGLALQFRDLPLAAKHCLGRMVESLPYLEVREAGNESESVVVSEILGRESR